MTNEQRIIGDPTRAARRHLRMSPFVRKAWATLIIITLAVFAPAALAQTRSYPKEIRGYKVERAVVELKKPKRNSKQRDAENQRDDSDIDQLIDFGQPQLARVTPLGVTLEIPIVVAPIKQSGHVEFLVFEDMVVNGTSVEIDEYHRDFDLPNKHPLTLQKPVRVYLYLPQAALATIGELTDSKQTWPVTGRVYVFGKFKKGIFSGKRCVPVELNLTMRNPLR